MFWEKILTNKQARTLLFNPLAMAHDANITDVTAL